MLAPEKLPLFMSEKSCVTHQYPDDMPEVERDTHRYDDCFCAPLMNQVIGNCEHSHAYHWIVYHKSIPLPETP